MKHFILSSYSGGFVINERSHSPNKVECIDGELSETQVKAIAYKLLAMVESDKVR